MLDLFHRTSFAAAETIMESRAMLSAENTQEAYFSNRPDGQAAGYGPACVHVRVPSELASLEDEYPDGEEHYRVSVSDLRPEHFVGVSL